MGTYWPVLGKIIRLFGKKKYFSQRVQTHPWRKLGKDSRFKVKNEINGFIHVWKYLCLTNLFCEKWSFFVEISLQEATCKSQALPKIKKLKYLFFFTEKNDKPDLWHCIRYNLQKYLISQLCRYVFASLIYHEAIKMENYI